MVIWYKPVGVSSLLLSTVHLSSHFTYVSTTMLGLQTLYWVSFIIDVERNKSYAVISYIILNIYDLLNKEQINGCKHLGINPKDTIWSWWAHLQGSRKVRIKQESFLYFKTISYFLTHIGSAKTAIHLRNQRCMDSIWRIFVYRFCWCPEHLVHWVWTHVSG